MHAKMTRDRKKNFIATIEKTIEQLERDCQKMRDILEKVGAQKQQQQQVLTAPVTPLMTPRQEGATQKTASGALATVPAPALPADLGALTVPTTGAPASLPFVMMSRADATGTAGALDGTALGSVALDGVGDGGFFASAAVTTRSQTFAFCGGSNLVRV